MKQRCYYCFDYCEMYYIKPELWAAHGLHPKDWCCLSCLTNLLGRKLRMEDLATKSDGTYLPINGLVYFMEKV